jgi:hypothetical protein
MEGSRITVVVVGGPVGRFRNEGQHLTNRGDDKKNHCDLCATRFDCEASRGEQEQEGNGAERGGKRSRRCPCLPRGICEIIISWPYSKLEAFGVAVKFKASKVRVAPERKDSDAIEDRHERQNLRKNRAIPVGIGTIMINAIIDENQCQIGFALEDLYKKIRALTSIGLSRYQCSL